MQITILRLGHRLPRDERISTHVALVARAFGANSIYYSGQTDSGLEKSVSAICEKWGGKTNNGEFFIKYQKNPLQLIKQLKNEGFKIIHLTMYGLSVEEIKHHDLGDKLLIIVGSEHVPGEIYSLSDFNVSVTNQPHSEVAALAITLDRINPKYLDQNFNGILSITPTNGKKVVNKL